MLPRILGVACLLGAALTPAEGRADDPKWQYGKQEEVKKVLWKATAQAGLILNTGNSNNVSFSASGMALRNDGKNKLQLDVGGAYAKATLLTVSDANANMVVDPGEIQRIEKNSTALWNTKLRYDRFFTANNLGYLSIFAMGNEPAGKRVTAGVQVGYSRQLYKDDRHLIVAELGYDFSYENLVAPMTPDFYLHSLRAYAGYVLSLSQDTLVSVDLEYLGTMNPFDGPYGKRVESFEDSRLNGRASLTTRLYKAISFRFGFTARWDNVPAPMPKLDLPYAAGFKPAAEKLDTITDASLIVSFL